MTFDDTAEDLFENAPCGYLAAGPDGTLLRVNATFLRWTGFEREQLVGVKRFQDLLSVGGRMYYETHFAPLLQMQGIVREIAVEVVTADGTRLPVLVNAVLVHDEHGAPQGIRTTVVDATERRLYERELLAARDRERVAREQTETVAHTLQRNMLAGDPPHDPRFEVAALYQPAGETLEVGGDWHDAFRLPGDRLGVVVGDVVGRGLDAASAMSQLRSAVRALSGAGLRPSEVLSHLDTFVEQIPSARYATLVYADVDPGTGAVALAAGGHPPPIVVDAAGVTRVLMEGRSPPLGVPPDEPRAETGFSLPPGGTLLLYTDGIVERRAEPIDAGIERLAAVARRNPGASPGELVDSVSDVLLGRRGVDDDACVLALRRSDERGRRIARAVAQ